MKIQPIYNYAFAQDIIAAVQARVEEINTGEKVLLNIGGFTQIAGSLGTPGVRLDFRYVPLAYDAMESIFKDYAHQAIVNVCNITSDRTRWLVVELRTEHGVLHMYAGEMDTTESREVVAESVKGIADLIHEFFFNADAYVERVSRQPLPMASMRLALLAAKIKASARTTQAAE